MFLEIASAHDHMQGSEQFRSQGKGKLQPTQGFYWNVMEHWGQKGNLNGS